SIKMLMPKSWPIPLPGRSSGRKRRVDYWGAFHGDSEAVIRQALWIGLTPDHPSLQKVIFFLEKVLLGEEIFHQRCEKHDNPRWWLEIFMPLCAAATLGLLAPEDPLLEKHTSLWR